MAPKSDVSSFSSVAFGDIVVKSSKMLKVLEQLKVEKNNYVASFSIPCNIFGFIEIVKFLSKHPIEALTLST